MSKDFSTLYQSDSAIFGESPDPLLVEYHKEIPSELPVLDIGCGQGRNSVYLAEKGFNVVAIDPSKAGTEQISLRAKTSGLSITVSNDTFQTFDPGMRVFGTILAFGLIPLLKKEDISSLAEKLSEWTHPGSFIFVTGFTSEDPSFHWYSEEGTKIGGFTYQLNDGRIRTFLVPGEISTLFPQFEIVCHHEELGPWHRHGDSEPERHYWAELVAKRI